MSQNRPNKRTSFLAVGRFSAAPICLSPSTHLGIIFLLLSAALALLPALTARADDYNVTNTDASGPGSLRQAILDANANASHDVISFSPGVSGTIVLTDSLPAIGDDLTITGPDAEGLAISGDNAYRVFYVQSSAAVTITSVTIRDGRASDSAVVSPTFTAPGTPTALTFTLVVTDVLGVPSAPDTVVIAVTEYCIYLPLVLRNAGL